jgi:hypothetical protein
MLTVDDYAKIRLARRDKMSIREIGGCQFYAVGAGAKGSWPLVAATCEKPRSILRNLENWRS